MSRARPKYPSDMLDQFNARLPPTLLEMIREAAVSNNRSMNSEVTKRLEDSFKPARQVSSELSRLLDEHIQAEVKSRVAVIIASLGSAA